MMTGWEQCFYPLSASPITAASLEVRGAEALSRTDGTSATFGVRGAVGPLHPDVAREEVPAPSKTASVMGREGRGRSLGPHTVHRRMFSDGGGVCRPAGQNDFVHRGPVGLGDGRREFWRSGVKAYVSS